RSRRRHTGFSRDWSSDVCSSDLIAATPTPAPAAGPLGSGPQLERRAGALAGSVRDGLSQGSLRLHESGGRVMAQLVFDVARADQIGRATRRGRVEVQGGGAGARR